MRKGSSEQKKSTFQNNFDEGIRSLVSRLGVAGGTELMYILAEKGAGSKEFQDAVTFYGPRMKPLLELTKVSAPDLVAKLSGAEALPSEISESNLLSSPARIESGTIDGEKYLLHEEYISLSLFARKECGVKTAEVKKCVKHVVSQIRKSSELQKHTKPQTGSFRLKNNPESKEIFRKIIGRYSGNDSSDSDVSDRRHSEETSNNGEYVSLSVFVAKMGIPVIKRPDTMKTLRTLIGMPESSLTEFTRPRGQNYQIIGTSDAMSLASRLLKETDGLELSPAKEPASLKLPQQKVSRTYDAQQVADIHEVPLNFITFATTQYVPKLGAILSDAGKNPLYTPGQAEIIRELWAGPEGLSFRKSSSRQ